MKNQRDRLSQTLPPLENSLTQHLFSRMKFSPRVASITDPRVRKWRAFPSRGRVQSTREKLFA